jgi:hypothetical protein
VGIRQLPFRARRHTIRISPSPVGGRRSATSIAPGGLFSLTYNLNMSLQYHEIMKKLIQKYERKTAVSMTFAIIAAANDWSGFHHPTQ